MTALPALDPRDVIAEAVQSMGTAGLLTARAEMRRLVQDDGIRHGQAGPVATPPARAFERLAESDGLEGPRWHLQGRDWVIDPIPVVIDAPQWRDLEVGLVQRARLLDLVLADVYGPRRLIGSGLLPAEVVLSHPGFVPQVIDPGTARLPLTSADIGRDSDGRWTVIADRSAIGVGAGYAMATRRITSRVMANLHRQVAPARLRGFFHSMTAALLDAAPHGRPSPRAVLLSSGTSSSTAYEHGFLATLLGLPLVEAEDLSMEEGRVWIRSGSRRQAVDVVYRRVDSAHADPLEIRSRARSGVPGLLEAARRGTVAVVNPLGSEVIDNPALHAYLPGICAHLLGEDLMLPGVQTHWCGDPAGLSHVLANLESLIVKPVSHETAQATHCGWLLSGDRRAELRARITAAPWQWVGQEPLTMADEPYVGTSGIEQRRFVLRTFALTRDDRVEVLTGGLGRVAPDAGTWIVPVMGSGIAKDVWVLPPDDGAAPPLRLADDRDDRPPTPLGHLSLTPRVAENLFWVGRYAERADGTTRLLRVVDDLVEDHATRAGTPGYTTALAMRDLLVTLTQVPVEAGESAPEHLRRLVRESGLHGSIGYAVARLVTAAQEVRDVLSHDIWHVLSRMERTVAATAPVQEQLQPQLYDLLESTLAVSGVLAESLVRDQTWGWVDAGVRLERAQRVVALLRTALSTRHSAIVEAQVAEAVLEAGESIITHRRRTVSGEGPAAPVDSAVAILLLDPANPRSVAFQVARLREDLDLVDADADVVGEVAAYLADVSVSSLDEASREDVRDLLDKVAYDLRGISRDLRREHFARASRPTLLASHWSPGGSA